MELFSGCAQAAPELSGRPLQVSMDPAPRLGWIHPGQLTSPPAAPISPSKNRKKTKQKKQNKKSQEKRSREKKKPRKKEKTKKKNKKAHTPPSTNLCHPVISWSMADFWLKRERGALDGLARAWLLGNPVCTRQNRVLALMLDDIDSARGYHIYSLSQTTDLPLECVLFCVDLG